MARTVTKIRDKTGLEIKSMLMCKGIKLNTIAARAGVTPSAVTSALNDSTEYIGRRIRPVIADALGVSEEELWPVSTMPKKMAQ